MSKRRNSSHNKAVSGILALALAVTAVLSTAQLAGVSNNLSASVSGRYIAMVCPDGTTVPDGQTCPMSGGTGGTTGGTGGTTTTTTTTINCNSLGGLAVSSAECTAADLRKDACAAPMVWGTANGGTCTAGTTTTTTTNTTGGTASSYLTQPTCQSANFYWYNNVCNATNNTSTTTTTTTTVDTVDACQGRGGLWSAGTSTCSIAPGGGTGTTTTNTCSGATPYRCSDNSCAVSSTYCPTTTTTTTTTDTVGACQGRGGVWNAGSSTCSIAPGGGTGTTTTNTCSGATPYRCSDNSCAVSSTYCPTTTTTTTTTDTVGACQGRGGVWSAGTSTCSIAPGGTNTNTNTNTTTTGCGYNQYWDGTACVQYTAPTQPATFQDFFAGPQCSRTAAHIDPYCFGFNQWNDKAGCEAAGYMWDSGRSDCFPGFGTQVGPMMPPPMPFGGMVPGVSASMTQSAGADFTQWMKVSGTEGQTQDYCSTTTGRNDPGCAYQRLKGTESTTDMYSMIKAQAQTFGTGTGPNAADFEAYGEVEQMFDRMRFETGGAYCPEMEQLGKVLYEAETNEDLAMIEAVAADSDTYIKQLQGCGGVNRFNELTDLRSKVEALADSEGKEDLLAKIDAVSADSSALENPRTMGDLWKAYGMLQHKFKQERSEEGPCNSIERTKGDIEAYLSGEHDVEFGGEAPSQEIVEGVLENIETTLAEANKVGGPEGKKMCKRMKEELKKMEKQYFGDQGVLYNPMEEYMMNLYGDFDYIDSQTAMYEGMEGVNLDEIKAFIQQMIMEQFAKMKDEIIATIRAEIKTALANVIDFEALILENPTLSGATTAVADATEGLSEISRKAEEIQQNATQELAANLEQLPPELVEDIYDRQETVLTEFFQPILTADPAVLEEVKVPLENLLATFVSQPLPEEIVAELTSYDLVGTISNAIEASGVVNDEGTYIISDEDDREVVVEILQDVLTEAQEIVEPERLELAQVEEGLRPDNPDFDPKAWWGTAAMGRVADGSTKGEGDGSLNPGGILLKAHVAVQMDRALEGDASVSSLGDQADEMDTWMQEGAALALEAGAVDESRVAQEMAEPATRGDAIFMMARVLANENSEIEDMINELSCTLDEDDLADTNCSMEHAAEINFAVNAGFVRGNEGTGGTLSLNADSNVNRAESWTIQGRMETFLTEVEAVGADLVFERMEGEVNSGDPGQGITD